MTSQGAIFAPPRVARQNEVVVCVERSDAQRPRYGDRPVKLIAATLIVFAFLFASPPAAEAHEIAVAVVVSVGADSSEVDASAVLNGLRLAIDQSPDVGHAPGPDAGDHLGGVDVEVIDLGNASEFVLEATVRAAVTDGATLIVVVGEAEAIAAVVEAVPPTAAFTIAVLTGTDDVALSLPAAVLRRSPTVDADAVRTLSTAFETAFGRELSESDGIGYDVGQLLDVLIGETDGALPDAATVDNVLATAQERLTFTTIGSIDDMPPRTAETPPSSSTNSNRSAIWSAVLASFAVAAIGMLSIRILSRRSTRSG